MFRTSLATFLALVCALAVAPATGCGGGGGGSGSGSTSGGVLTPSVTSVTPVDGSSNVSVHSTQIVVTFSTDMNAGTIDNTTFVVEDITTGVAPVAVAGVIAYDSNLRQATWTLTQVGLNTSTPGLAAQPVFAFDTVYRISLTSGIRGPSNLPIVPALTTFFRSAQTEFGILAAGTDPQNGATDVLIDPYRVVVNGQLAFATLKVQIDVPLAAASVNGNNVQLHLTSANGTIVPTLVGFDTASNTIYVAPDGTSNPNPAFPGEPLLTTNTAYVLVLTTGLASNVGAHPQSPLELSFRTIDCQIRAPRFLPTGGSRLDIALAEAFGGATATSPGNASSDSNGDGVVSSNDDEFTEIVNISSDYLNLMDFEYGDSGNLTNAGNELIAWTGSTLPAGTRHLSLLAPGASFVIWNGPTGAGPGNVSNVPAGIPASRVTIGHSKAFFAGWPSSGMLASGGDTLIMRAITTGQVRDVMIETFTNGTSGATLASSVLSNGTSGTYVSHRSVSANVPWSPGRQTNGAIYR